MPYPSDPIQSITQVPGVEYRSGYYYESWGFPLVAENGIKNRKGHMRAERAYGDKIHPTDTTHGSWKWKGQGSIFAAKSSNGDSPLYSYQDTTVETDGPFASTIEGMVLDNQDPLFKPKTSDIPYGMLSNKALSRLQEEQFALGVFLGELLETANHLATRSRDLALTLRALRRGRLKDAANQLGVKYSKKRDTAASFWLEYNYAIRPVIQDVYALQAQVSKLCGADLLLSAKAKTKVNTHVPLDLSAGSTTGTGNLRMKDVAVYKLMAKLVDPTLSWLQQWGLVNPASVAWELVPFSFCIDWLYPMGDYFDNLSATKGLSFDGGYKSVKRQWLADYSWFKPGSYVSKAFVAPGVREYAFYQHIFTGHARGQGTVYDRSTFSSFPSATLPRFSGLSTNNIVTTAALIHQLKN